MPLIALLKRSLTLRLLAVYGVIFTCGLLLTGSLVFNRVVKLVDGTIDNYGKTVASQLANTSLDAVMQRDMIALQAHLARLLKTRGIVSAAIYDVENRLMAQAGATPGELTDKRYLHNYTTTLALGDNIAGHVVVTLETAELEQLLPQIRWILGGGAMVIAISLLLAARHFARDIHLQRVNLAQALINILPAALNNTSAPIKPLHLSEEQMYRLLGDVRDYVTQVQAPSPAALRAAAADLLNNSGGRACLLLECHNLDLLQRQVSRERLHSLLDRMQQQVEKTCGLYSAQRMPVAGACIKIALPATPGQIGDALLQAACHAHVLSGVLAQCRDEELGIRLQWSLALDWQAPCDNDILRNRQQALDDQRGQWLCRQVGSGELAVSAEAGALLQDQDKLTLAVEHGEGGSPFYRITGFVHTQRMLLESQISRLCETS